jgi:hypothetical protein
MGNIATENLAMIRLALGEENMSRTGTSEWKSPKSPRLKKARQAKSKVRNMHIISLDIKVILRKNSSRQSNQSIPHTAVMFYGYSVNMYENFFPNFGNKRTGCSITTRRCFHHTIVCKIKLTVVPNPSYSPYLDHC